MTGVLLPNGGRLYGEWTQDPGICGDTGTGILLPNGGRLYGAEPCAPTPGGGFDPTIVGWHDLWWASSLDLATDDPVVSWPAEVGGITLAPVNGVYGEAGFGARPTVTAQSAEVPGVTFATGWSAVVIGYQGYITDANVPNEDPGLLGVFDGVNSFTSSLTADGSTTLAGPSPSGPSIAVFYVDGADSYVEINGTRQTGDAGTLTFLAPFYWFSPIAGLMGLYDGDVTTDPEWATFVTEADTYYGLP